MWAEKRWKLDKKELEWSSDRGNKKKSNKNQKPLRMQLSFEKKAPQPGFFLVYSMYVEVPAHNPIFNSTLHPGNASPMDNFSELHEKLPETGLDLLKCLLHTHECHLAICTSTIDQAKLQCAAAVRILSRLLNNKENVQINTIKALAQYTGEFYENILAKGRDLLLFTQKVTWMSSSVYGYNWFPVIELGSTNTLQIAPVSVENKPLKTPELGLGFKIKFSPTDLDWSLAGVHDLYQDLLPNCSFVLSLLLIAEMGMEAHLRSLVQPFGHLGLKVLLHINGAAREVAMSLDLPFIEAPHQNRSLFVRSSTNADLKWPAYLEKAFLISLGQHYAFNGSNMAQDTFMLTGWFPEYRSVDSSSLDDIADLWRLKKEGQVMLGIGTGPISDQLARQLGVISQHDYVVSGFDEKSKTLTLKNPWVDSSDQSSRELEVDLSLVRQFKYLYVNWKPQYRSTAEAAIVITANKWTTNYIAEQPQYDFRNTSNEAQSVALVVEQFVDNPPQTSFSVTVYENNHGRIYTDFQYPEVQGKLSNSRVAYLKVETKPNSTYTVVVKSMADSTTKFLLSVHHNLAELELLKTKPRYQHSQTIPGLWNFGYGGGNWACESFIDNPQYDFNVSSPSSMMIILRSERPTSDINFHLLHLEKEQVGKKLQFFDKGKLLFDAKYSRSLQMKEVTDLEPGHYRLIVSNFTDEDAGSFTLLVFNNGESPLILTQVPQALGTFTQVRHFEWENDNRHKLTISSDQPETHVTCRFNPADKSKLLSAYRPAIRASVFDSETCEPIVVNRDWSDCVYGVFLECTLPRARHPYIILVERFERGTGLCRVSTGSTRRVRIEDANLS